jgi:hypothetical protein
MRVHCRSAWACAVVWGLSMVMGTAQGRVLDDFRDGALWQAFASDQVHADLRRDADGSLCLDADFGSVSGYAVMRRELPLEWPAHFDLSARLKGRGATNDVQIKFVDGSGDNVWWVNRPNTVLPGALSEWRLKRRHVVFAWGPAAERELRQTRYVEFVIAAGREGGKTSLCVAALRLAERAPDPVPWPEPRVHHQGLVTTLDFQVPREFNGVALRWPAGTRRLDYGLWASDDGRRWRRLRTVRASDGGLDALFLPESEARWLQVRQAHPVRATPGTLQPALSLRSAAQWPDANAVLGELAADLPRGHLPRAFLGEQNYWTLVGVDGGGPRSGLLSEDGALELGRGGPSMEPVVWLHGAGERAVTWADVRLEHHLPEGFLPQPIVRWRHDAFGLDVQATADGPARAPELLARYTLRNTTTQPQTYTLAWVLRPWQVNPPQQFLNTPGGVRPVRHLAWKQGALQVDGRMVLKPVQTPAQVTASHWDGGLALDALRAAPTLASMTDPQSQASAMLQYRITLAPGQSQTWAWVARMDLEPKVASAISLASGGRLDSVRTTPSSPDAAAVQMRFDMAARHWRERLTRVGLQVGGGEGPGLAAGPSDTAWGAAVPGVAHSLRSALAQILMSRDGAMLQPGTRSYSRSWVRDGVMMVAGLLRLGEVQAAREFMDAFQPHVFASGKVPCCVDARGADPVVENDSHGQYLYGVAEIWRHTADRAFLQRHWPTVQRVVMWQEALRQSERGTANRQPDRIHFFGLMPPSISHEGYSDKPAYSYWDDFWALRGYKDAVVIALALGQERLAHQWALWRDEFEVELRASVEATARHHRIDFIAGAADRGDFDATSTTIALNPAQAAVPRALLESTFERYWAEAAARAEGRKPWRDYTPYEWRTVGALVRLGRGDRAHALMRFFFADQRPAGWNQWAEVVLPQIREPRFLGDMPHAWVSSDYIRSALDLFAFERDSDQALVIGAGWHPQWMAYGLSVERLSTPWGLLSYRLERDASGWTLQLPGLQSTPGLAGSASSAAVHLRLAWPLSGTLPQALLDGQPLVWQGRELVLPSQRATVRLNDTGLRPAP